VEHFADSVFVAPGRCWRLVTDFAGRPEHCAEPVTWVGRTRLKERNGNGRLLRVWSCDGHADDLEARKQVAANGQVKPVAVDTTVTGDRDARSAAGRAAKAASGKLADAAATHARVVVTCTELSDALSGPPPGGN
jgi:hypothetical protein